MSKRLAVAHIRNDIWPLLNMIDWLTYSLLAQTDARNFSFERDSWHFVLSVVLLLKKTKLSLFASKSCVWAQALLAQMFAAVYLAVLMYNPGKQAQIVPDDAGDAGKGRISEEQRLHLNLVLAKSLGRDSSAVSSGVYWLWQVCGQFSGH